MITNINLLKYILPLNFAWFWQGIWLLFYLRVTNYAGVGLLEASMFFIGFLLEVPTGAISDLLGKKNNLVVAFFLYSVGNLIMAMSNSYEMLVFSVFVLVIGGALYSGTAQAIVYDSLKTIKKEDDFEKVQSRIESNSLLFMAIASIVGGFLYSVDNTYPFIATGIAGFIGMLTILFFVEEPPIDTEKFSLKNYIRQTQKGFTHLFIQVPKGVLFNTIFIVSFAYIFDQVVENAFAIEIGFSEKGLGILFAIIPLVGAFSAHIYPLYQKKYSQNIVLAVFTFLFFISALLSPYLGIAVGTLMILYRAFTAPVMDVVAAGIVNRNVESKYRATAISTFEMVKKLPYISIAYFLGGLIDDYSASKVILWLSLGYIVVFCLVFLVRNLVEDRGEK